MVTIVAQDEKIRVNLYVDSNAYEFAKKWAYVTGKPVSHWVNDYFTHLMGDVLHMTPQQWFARIDDPLADMSIEEEIQYNKDSARQYEEWLEDKEEVEYCQKHPDSTRAKMRLAMLEEMRKKEEEESKLYAVQQKKREKERDEFTKRWEETFLKK